jgi:phage tail sheath protein FI
VKDNTGNTNTIADYTLAYDTGTSGYIGSNLTLAYATDSAIQADDLLNAYDIFSNKEELDIDIVIANELDAGASAKVLVDTREDCIGFIGANYGDVVGQKSATAVSNLVAWRQSGSLNYNDMFLVACANYKYQYDRYNDKYRWVNISGDIAGLRAQTSQNRASWWASAGLERGQIKNAIKLAFNPTQGQRDMLYKNGLNPIVSFPGQGTVMWGQKTLLDKPSSFDRVNVRGLFNTMERSLSKMAKYQVMEFNDNFTRNRIVSMIKPYLTTVQSGRGIEDFLVICDESNNTPDVISRNQLVVDIYIKPTYVAEFINLRFTNAGTNSFAQIIGG